jgi:hypothetical protein
MNESKPTEVGAYFGELSPQGQWKWNGTGLPGDDWIKVISPSSESPPQVSQQLTSAQLQYDWIELYLTPVTS